MPYKSSLNRNRRDVENVGLEMSGVNSAYKNYLLYHNIYSKYPSPIHNSKRSSRNHGDYLSNEENLHSNTIGKSFDGNGKCHKKGVQ